jgi:hypothetical protein
MSYAFFTHQNHTRHRLSQPTSASDEAVGAATLLDAIFNATMSSHVAQLYGIPTDCPQREKRGV